MNRLESAAGEFGQGFVSTIAKLSKGFGVTEKQSALQMLNIYHQYENGNADTGPISASRSQTYNASIFFIAGETDAQTNCTFRRVDQAGFKFGPIVRTKFALF